MRVRARTPPVGCCAAAVATPPLSLGTMPPPTAPGRPLAPGGPPHPFGTNKTGAFAPPSRCIPGPRPPPRLRELPTLPCLLSPPKLFQAFATTIALELPERRLPGCRARQPAAALAGRAYAAPLQVPGLGRTGNVCLTHCPHSVRAPSYDCCCIHPTRCIHPAPLPASAPDRPRRAAAWGSSYLRPLPSGFRSCCGTHIDGAPLRASAP